MGRDSVFGFDFGNWTVTEDQDLKISLPNEYLILKKVRRRNYEFRKEIT